MRKLITLDDDQNARVEAVMKETMHKSLGTLLVFLVLFYEQNQKRPQGRPRSASRDDDADSSDDGIARYQCPDYPLTKSRYTKDEVDGWYDFRGLAVPPDAYKIHPDYKGN